MMKKYLLVLYCFLGGTGMIWGQETDANIFGDTQSNGEHIPFVNIYIEGTTIGTTTDVTGHYMLVNLPEGEHTLVAQAIGYEKQTRKVIIIPGESQEVNFDMKEVVMSLDEVVVTGTKTFKRQTESAVIVNVLDSKILNMIQANTVSEGLCFQPGLRVEVDCQTCNYTQLRMNGLGGSYSQILINGRPVFSPLTGLYGLEQIPTNMVDRIEVVRGGGSALYGSSAIGGTVNIITRTPSESTFEVGSIHSFINGGANDHMINGGLSVVTRNNSAGLSAFVSTRKRDYYDHNNDNFSEIPMLRNNSYGLTAFFKPTRNQKLELSMSSLYEYRYGGEMIEGKAHEAQQSEERTHNVLMGGLDYELNFNDQKNTLIFYLAGQRTNRDHYTGIMPDDSAGIVAHFLDAPYGKTLNQTYQIGTQVNSLAENFLNGTNLFTVGAEYVYDEVHDVIEAYNYEVDQLTRNLGVFLQSDWSINRATTLLLGLRMDKHNFVDKLVFNPRVSFLYKLKQSTQFRLSWSTGFRAPQAFDSDLHIAFAAGGVSRIVLSDDLKEERSHSLSVSANYDKPAEKYIFGFTLEAFYTRLLDAFALEEAGQDEFGLIYEKVNGANSTVQGVTAEFRINLNRKMQFETGATFQTSAYDEPIAYSSTLEPTTNYLKTPDRYGFYTLTLMPGPYFNASLSGIYTGKMQLLHVAGAPELPDSDEYVITQPYFENNLKLSYMIPMKNIESGIEFSTGIKNIFNAYQEDFDTGKNRDSNYIYGPALPRTVFFGIKIRSL